MLTLERVNAFQGELVRTLKWPPHSEEVRACAHAWVLVACPSMHGRMSPIPLRIGACHMSLNALQHGPSLPWP